MKRPDIHTTHVALPQIYAYTTPEIARHHGWVKIGYTEKADVRERIKQQCHTADIAWQLEWHGNAVYEGTNETFMDKDFHAYLNKLGVPQQPDTEWFKIGVDESKHDFYDFRENHGIMPGQPTHHYQLRDSQEQAVEQTMASFTDRPQTEYLWNAKPRFGKTLAVYDLCLRMQLKRILVVTNRPAIADSWYNDYLKFVGPDNYLFVSRVAAIRERKHPCLSREQYLQAIKQPGKTKNIIEFVSLQDLKGSLYFGGNYDKLEEVAKLTWDLLVIDEAHEGVDTYKTDVAFDQIHRCHTLHLSGTPFKALANEKFPQDAIFNWTYADECRAKEQWNERRGTNPYAEMPRLNMYTYRMSDIVLDKVRKGVEIDGDQEAYAFDLNEFFRVERGRFVHDEAVDKWLDALSRQPRYPFSTPELRHALRHTFWLLNRVDSAKKLAEKLRDTKRHPEFADIEIVVAAGDGKTDDDEVIEDDSSLRRVRKAIHEHPQGTITLSVGQLTTGVTIPEWTGVLILSNMKSPAQYMQAAFRAQTPYLYLGADGSYHRKENAYIFDFDPARTLTNYEEMANGLCADTASGYGDTDTRKRHIRELLNFFPVIGEDENGEMEPLDAEQVMLIPRKIRSKEVVRSGFMSNFLFANISSIYGCSAGILDIINHFEPVKKPKDKVVDAQDVEELSQDLDEEGNAKPDTQKVEDIKDQVFGDKIFGEPKEELDNYVEESMRKYSQGKEHKGKTAEEQMIDQVSEKLTSLLLSHADEGAKAQDLDTLSKRNKGKATVEIKKAVNEQLGAHFHQASIEKKKIDHQCAQDCEGKTTQQQKAIREAAEEQKKEIDNQLSETIHGKTREMLDKGSEIIANTFEEQRIEAKKGSTDELIRDHLRGFSRTIPSFLMGYGNEHTTLQNFDENISDAVFLEVTSVTKEQFHLLRDGGDYVNPATGATEHSPGHFFDEVVFNDSVKEFMRLRKKLANYFETTAEEDIFDYIPPQKTNQIFTPKWVVKEMVDLLEKENPGCFDDPDKTFADLYMKSGQYITEIVKRLYNSTGLRKAYPDSEARIRHIFAHQVYGLAPTECIYRIAMRYILGFDDTIHIAPGDHHLRQADSLPAAKDGTMEAFLDSVFKD
ncbi:DEAD/DEAH box helicase family protein [Prevotella sp. AGR2160]|uniref:DEAD/DEAH box helicase family protein n=1 Tax=Prevotella sp. AGR2160 TaxID=1280674 RepID=UPI00040DB4F3|nr:DEAD/DEAH box helicase family protein [Prevotella sp. AGR2160]